MAEFVPAFWRNKYCLYCRTVFGHGWFLGTPYLWFTFRTDYVQNCRPLSYNFTNCIIRRIKHVLSPLGLYVFKTCQYVRTIGLLICTLFKNLFQIHSVSLIILVNLVLIHLLIHFSTHLWHHPHSRHPSLLYSFSPGSKPNFSTNPFHRRFLLPTGLPHDNGTGPDLSRSSLYF